MVRKLITLAKNFRFNLPKITVKIELSYVKQIVKAGAIPRLVDILNSDPDPKIKLEAAWALTNISSDTTEHVEMLISHVNYS